MAHFSMRVDDQLVERIDSAAEREFRTRAAMIRELCRRALALEEDARDRADRPKAKRRARG